MLGCVLTVRGGDTLTRRLPPAAPTTATPTRPRLVLVLQRAALRHALRGARCVATHALDGALQAPRIVVYVLTRRVAARVVQRAMAQTDGVIDVSHVCKLTRAARKQGVARHNARAVELYERAIAAAEALLQPDCLIVVSLFVSYLNVRRIIVASAVSGEDVATGVEVQRHVHAHLALLKTRLPGVLESLERRRAAGTLLPGRCRAHEVAWEADCTRTDIRLGGEPELDAERLSEAAQHVGIEAYFAAARSAIFAAQTGQLEAVVPDVQLIVRSLDFVEHALLLALERKPDDSKLIVFIPPAQQLFLDDFRTRLLPDLTPEEPRCARLLVAWRGLEQSGQLQKFPAEQTHERCERTMKSLAAAQAAKDAGVPPRACALPACSAREAHAAHFKKCSACSGVFYCSKQHQPEHWPAHKAACKAARKAARKAASQAAGEGGASLDA